MLSFFPKYKTLHNLLLLGFTIFSLLLTMTGCLNYWYVGRGFKNKNWDITGSPLANPYKVNKDDSNREEAIALYKEWLWNEKRN